jgi:hypothetical protein
MDTSDFSMTLSPIGGKNRPRVAFDAPSSPSRIHQLEARTKMTEMSIKKAKGTVDTLIEQSKAQQKVIAQYKLEKFEQEERLHAMGKLNSLHEALAAKYEDCVSDNVALKMENSKLRTEEQQAEQLSILLDNEKAHGWNQEQQLLRREKEDVALRGTIQSYAQQIQQLELIPQQAEQQRQVHQQEQSQIEAALSEKHKETAILEEALKQRDVKIDRLEQTIKRQTKHFQALQANTLKDYTRLERQQELAQQQWAEKLELLASQEKSAQARVLASQDKKHRQELDHAKTVCAQMRLEVSRLQDTIGQLACNSSEVACMRKALSHVQQQSQANAFQQRSAVDDAARAAAQARSLSASAMAMGQGGIPELRLRGQQQQQQQQQGDRATMEALRQDIDRIMQAVGVPSAATRY